MQHLFWIDQVDSCMEQITPVQVTLHSYGFKPNGFTLDCTLEQTCPTYCAYLWIPIKNWTYYIRDGGKWTYAFNKFLAKTLKRSKFEFLPLRFRPISGQYLVTHVLGILNNPEEQLPTQGLWLPPRPVPRNMPWASNYVLPFFHPTKLCGEVSYLITDYLFVQVPVKSAHLFVGSIYVTVDLTDIRGDPFSAPQHYHVETLSQHLISCQDAILLQKDANYLIYAIPWFPSSNRLSNHLAEDVSKFIKRSYKWFHQQSDGRSTPFPYNLLWNNSIYSLNIVVELPDRNKFDFFIFGSNSIDYSVRNFLKGLFNIA